MFGSCLTILAAHGGPTPETQAERVRHHLERIESALRSKPTSSLPTHQRVRRLENLDRLHEYWVKGRFPRNTEFPGQRLPHIRDRYGTSCAVAYLIEQSGSSALVDELSKTNNLIRIDEVEEGPLLDWLAEAGLTR